MEDAQALLAVLDLAWREIALFASVGFVLLGTSELAIDLIWLLRRRGPRPTLADLPPPERPGRIAVFVPAWDEAAVIADMLRHTLKRWKSGDFVLYVGCYPNDPATIAAVKSVGDHRIRLVIGPAPGPTTKADCLNHLWAAMKADEPASGGRFKAVLLHDAEDIVHSAELDLFDRLIERFDLVQIPVLPLIDARSRYISGHYAEEFVESHTKTMVVRQTIGAAIPAAGVGCAISRGALEEFAASGGPFDKESLVEDYEMGLRLASRSAFVRIASSTSGLIATRALFPQSLEAAVSQKSRWALGIALQGWDRLGWSGGMAERWMRMRDRQAPFAALLLLVGYLSAIFYLIRAVAVGPIPIGGVLGILLVTTGILFLWRLGLRIALTASAYGWHEGLRALPRVLVANAIAIMAARRAVTRYLLKRDLGWNKTDHAFPGEVPAE